jgi:hypothetical protein
MSVIRKTTQNSLNGLNFGTHSGIQDFSVSDELKSRRELAGGRGNCTLAESSIQENKDEDGNVISHKLKLFFDGVDGGGAIDVLTTQSPTFFKKGIARLKYLLALAGIEFPESCKTPVIVANAHEANEATEAVATTLQAYNEEHGAEAFAEMFEITDSGEIVLKEQGAFRDIFGDTEAKMIYADSDAVVEAQSIRDNALYELRTSDEWKAMSKPEKQEATKEIREAYNQTLNSMEAVLCVCNYDAFNDMSDAISKIDKGLIFHVTCLKGDTSKAGKYAVAK